MPRGPRVGDPFDDTRCGTRTHDSPILTWLTIIVSTIQKRAGGMWEWASSSCSELCSG